MTARQEIILSVNTGLDSLSQTGTSGGWLQDNVVRAKRFDQYMNFKGRGRIVFAWLLTESASQTDGAGTHEMTLNIVCVGRLNLDRGIIDDEAEKMVHDIKRALIIGDGTGIAMNIVDVDPQILNDNEASIAVTAQTTYTEKFT